MSKIIKKRKIIILLGIFLNIYIYSRNYLIFNIKNKIKKKKKKLDFATYMRGKHKHTTQAEQKKIINQVIHFFFLID